MTTIQNLSHLTGVVTWDEYLQGDMVLTVLFDRSIPTVKLTSPENELFTTDFPGYQVDHVLKTIRITIPKAHVRLVFLKYLDCLQYFKKSRYLRKIYKYIYNIQSILFD